MNSTKKTHTRPYVNVCNLNLTDLPSKKQNKTKRNEKEIETGDDNVWQTCTEREKCADFFKKKDRKKLLSLSKQIGKLQRKLLKKFLKQKKPLHFCFCYHLPFANLVSRRPTDKFVFAVVE